MSLMPSAACCLSREAPTASGQQESGQQDPAERVPEVMEGECHTLCGVWCQVTDATTSNGYSCFSSQIERSLCTMYEDYTASLQEHHLCGAIQCAR